MAEDLGQGFKNLLKGLGAGAFSFVTLVLIPLYTIGSIQEYTLAGVELGITDAQFDDISFWITNLGLLIVALTFASASSPRRSIRKGVLNLFKIFFNLAYVWAYRFAGALEIRLDIVGVEGLTGYTMIDARTMVMIIVAVAFLNIILAILDLVDYAYFEDPKAGKTFKKLQKKSKGKEGQVTSIKERAEKKKEESMVKRAEEIKLSKNPELEKLKLEDDFLSMSIDEVMESDEEEEEN